MQQMQTNHQEAVTVLTSRIKSLEESLEISRKETSQANSRAASIQRSLQQKETECEELVIFFFLHRSIHKLPALS